MFKFCIRILYLVVKDDVVNVIRMKVLFSIIIIISRLNVTLGILCV